MHSQHTAFSLLYLFLSVFISLSLIYKYTQKRKRLSKTGEEIPTLCLLGWFHFFHDDPAHRVPACVGVSLLVRVVTAGPHIERYIYRALRDSRAVALNGSCANDVPRTARVNRSVNWHGALCTVESKEPPAASSAGNNPHVSLIDNPEVGIAVLFDE